MLIRGYSKALFSTWFHIPDVRSVFDAGEGINFSLAGRLARADYVFLTHGHTDHFTGLLNLLIARNRLGPGENELDPVTVFYPEASPNLQRYLDYVMHHLESNNFPDVIRLQTVRPGEDLPLPQRAKWFVRPFAVRHGPLPAVGYCLFETRDKLRPEFEGRPPQEIGRLVQEQGKDKILRPVDVPLVCYSGDSECPIETPCRQPKLLLHEATFLTGEDRSGSDHATMAEALEAARTIEPDRLLLYHFSARYTHEEIRQALENHLQANPLDCDVECVLPGKFGIWDF